MTVERKTRAEAREETVARLLDAAWEAFTEEGFAAASVEGIAARAGYTRGAFYSNFADKEAIFLALVDARLAGRVEAVREVMGRSTPVAVFSDLEAWSAGARVDDRWITLLAEFRVHALRSPALRERLAERDRAVRALYVEAIEGLFEAVGVRPPANPQLVAVLVEVLDNWFPVVQRTDPEQIPESGFFELLSMLFRAGVALSRSEQV
jgi:AcrR family transcriptional regulator